jgi:hypothetical protein
LDLLGPRGALTKPCRPLTFSLSPAGTPESVSVPPDALPVMRSSRNAPRSLTCEPRVPARLAGEGLTRGCPRMPSVVS